MRHIDRDKLMRGGGDGRTWREEGLEKEAEADMEQKVRTPHSDVGKKQSKKGNT